ncbi:MAG: hypothetical protein JW860_05400 [Sedimentisphaerales bacterium]|nr:hypothetical protein [Sedimentisphaerales bacterium]
MDINIEKIMSHLAGNLDAIKDIPAWLKILLKSNYNELPEFSYNQAEGHPCRPLIEVTKYDESYIKFLETQIQLKPRGPQSSDILRKRIQMLKPYVNQSLIKITFYKGCEYVTIRLKPDTLEIIYSECN